MSAMENIEDDFELVVGASKLVLSPGEGETVERKIAVADGGWYALLLENDEPGEYLTRYSLLKGQAPDDNRMVVAGELRGVSRTVHHSRVKPVIGGSNAPLAYNVEYVVYIPRGVITVTVVPGSRTKVGELQRLTAKRREPVKTSESTPSAGTQSE